jgi:4-alpha-glucanotransferase
MSKTNRRAKRAQPSAPNPGNPAFAERRSGLLLHVVSLPDPSGCGDLGPSAHAFIDQLADARQTWWQMLPVVPPSGGPGFSPYSSPSNFAGAEMLISPQALADDGLLDADDLAPPKRARDDRVVYEAIVPHRAALLRRAHENRSRLGRRGRAALERFASEQADWLDDHALHAALRRAHGDRAWMDWPAPLRNRKPAALASARRELAGEIDFQRFVQFLFDRQWRSLQAHARDRGVKLLGDVPIFVSHDSADVWAHRELFTLRADGSLRVTTGAPPDGFSVNGQKWGHPQYHWPAHEQSDFDWWVRRLRNSLDRFDAVRLDHFLGFHRTWQVAPDAPHARDGKWAPSPGRALFTRARRQLDTLPFLAEDLGSVVPEAIALRDDFAFPGMRIIQFGFDDGGGDAFHRPHRWPRDSVAYTATHDSDTTRGWFKHLRAEGRRNVHRFFDSTDATVVEAMIRAVFASVANTAIVPMQDLLDLDSRGRFNTPGTERGNWRWRLLPGAFTKKHVERLATLADTYDRAPRTD